MSPYTIDSGNAAEEYYDYLIRTARSKTKLEPPVNLHETVAAFDEHPSFKKQFIGFSTLLSVLFKQKSVQQRKLNMNEIKANPKSLKAPSGKTGLNRVDFVPDLFKRCKSTAAKSAIAMFCLLPYKEAIRRDVLFAVLQDSFDSVDDIIRLAKDNVKNIKDRIQGRTSCSDETRKGLIQSMLETSDVLRDKGYSKLAMAVHPNIYVTVVKYYIEKKPFASICPYDALINKYIQTCIASKSQASEREKIVNQFNVNAYAIVENMISSLPDDNETVKSVKFEEGRTYYVFEGPINFPRELAYTYKDYNGKRHQIVTYKDCLYDVIGTEDELFSDKTWQERLDSIEYTAKIIIQKKTGAELNEYNGNATLTTAWMDDDRFHCKHYTFVKREHKKANSAD